MENGFIRVAQQRGSRWSVLRGPRRIFLLGFAIKSHAVAYARAISLSGKFALLIDDKYGTAIRQSPASLTYPEILD
jgi:hypothetical protein